MELYHCVKGVQQTDYRRDVQQKLECVHELDNLGLLRIKESSKLPRVSVSRHIPAQKAELASADTPTVKPLRAIKVIGRQSRDDCEAQM